MMKNLDLCIGPAAAPQMQSALAGIETWYVMNGNPMWAFGDEILLWRQNAKVVSKNDTHPWPEFMEEKAPEFEEWLSNKRKEKIT